jgi:hypothetical protein
VQAWPQRCELAAKRRHYKKESTAGSAPLALFLSHRIEAVIRTLGVGRSRVSLLTCTISTLGRCVGLLAGGICCRLSMLGCRESFVSRRLSVLDSFLGRTSAEHQWPGE